MSEYRPEDAPNWRIMPGDTPVQKLHAAVQHEIERAKGIAAENAAVVREAIEKHRDEVVSLVMEHGWKRHPEELADHAFDCLLALVEGKPWPPAPPPGREERRG